MKRGPATGMLHLVDQVLAWDDTVLQWVNTHCGVGWPGTLASLLSSRWVMAITIMLAAATIAGRRRRRLALATAIALGLADLLTTRILKPAWRRLRPCHAWTGLHIPDGCGGDWGFPSGHAVLGFLLVTALAPSLRLGWIWLWPLATLVALSRIALGVHYPSDVVVGALIGAAAGGLVRAWVFYPGRPRFQRTRRARPR